MSKKITTADCRNFLVAHTDIQREVAGRYDPADYQGDPVYQAEMRQIVANGKNPKKWKRQRKYKVGSKADLESASPAGDEFGISFTKKNLGVDPTGGTIREFWLEDTDHITIAVLELNGVLYFLDDLSD